MNSDHNKHRPQLLHSILRISLLLILTRSTYAFVLRLNEGGLADLAEYTRQWMFETLKEMQLENYKHRFERGLATGELELGNLTIREFAPPLIKYRPSGKSLLYISTVGGNAQIYSDWTVSSSVLKMLGIPLHGTATGKITGFSSSIAVHVKTLFILKCVARFTDFDLRLTGSLAAEILHWFRNVIGRIMQARVEQSYCKLVSDKLLPWLHQQLEKMPNSLDLQFAPNLYLTQSLHSISTSENHMDLQLKNRFYSHGLITETISSVPRDLLQMHDNPFEPEHILEVFLDEATIQEIEEIITNITSPFLTTQCEILCLGKIVPELRSALGPTLLYAEVFTNEPPAVKILDGRAYIYFNVTFSLFEDRTEVPDIYFDQMIGLIEPDNQPVIQIEVLSEAEVFGEMKNRKLNIELNFHNSKASLVQSKINGLSQKKIDLIFSMIGPFLENATELFLGNGIEMSDLIRIPSRNESMRFEPGFIRLQADTNIRNLL
ncbi:hypothetical protein M3Y97_00196100 [Aphelenchoides bicaudatus]|nr:hypothetical protein M3Y97_00196100 [Aphelenchoides bicaudatus]